MLRNVQILPRKRRGLPATKRRLPPKQETPRQKYAESLRDLIRLHEFPNGVPVDTSYVEDDDFSGNQFAVCDIDQDGTEELLISY